jgi:pimeloyl-ACP methyl ester carboxylesterase
MTSLAFTRTGSGPTLVLLHALGLSRSAWDPVVPALAERFDVVAVDLPGFGASPPLPPTTPASPEALAAAVGALLDELGLTAPHVVGNSLGGWVALELAAARPVSSLTLISPAGLWRDRTPLYCRASLRLTHGACLHARGLLRRLVRTRPGRVLAFGQVLGSPTRMTPAQAVQAVDAVATAAGFVPALRATAHRCYQARPLSAPVTVAFGSRDRLLTRRRSRHVDQLPPDAVVRVLPACGHVPMTDDPAAVVALVTAATSLALPAPGRVA